MTTSGSGVGGNVGGPQIPLQEDINKTAWTEINKANLGIVPDSIDQAFTQANPRYSTGYLGGFGYRAASENPVLDHPLESTRVAESSEEPADTSWQQTYDELVAMMPDNMKQAFLNEAALPLDQRSEAFLAMDSVLTGAAQLFAQLGSVPDSYPADSIQGARTIDNILLPFTTLNGALFTTNELLLDVQAFLIQEGSNFTNFDGFVSTLKQMDASLLLLQFVSGSLSTTIDGQLSQDAIAAAERAATLLGSLSAQLDSVSLGSNLQILSSMVIALEIVALALAMPTTASNPLFFSLALALQGIDTEYNGEASFGPNLTALITTLTEGALSSEITNTSISTEAFLSVALTAAMMFAVGLSTLAVESGIGSYLLGTDTDRDGTYLLALQAAIQLLISSGTATTFFNALAEASGLDATAQANAAAVFGLFTLLLADTAAASQSGTTASDLMEWQSTYINQGLAATLGLNPNADAAQVAMAQVALESAAIALQQGDWPAFNEAIGSLFAGLGISDDALLGELQTISDAAGTTADAISNRGTDQLMTGIINVA